ncbi:MAG: 3'-5' exonuclease, partial [Bacteroidota bacterium]|nr:3'-5' exonuclease [Bacteroidota bacterium]
MLNLQLTKPLIVFDLETTGISISNDRIVEIACIKVHPDGREDTLHKRINPGMPIPAEVTAIHGISDADVANEPKFEEVARDLATYMQGCDFAGFNSNKFDFPMLVEEFLRAGVDFDVENRKFIDAQRIFHMMEPRNLSAAYRFYCDKNLENAHSAVADTRATWEIIQSQITRYPQLKNTIDELGKISGQNNLVDLAGRMLYNAEGKEVFNFGKHRNKLVEEVFKKEPGYYQWMMDNDFSLDTKRRLTKIKLR